jgi:hypothetical protein
MQNDIACDSVTLTNTVPGPQPFLPKCEGRERRVDVAEIHEFARLYGKSSNFFVS